MRPIAPLTRQWAKEKNSFPVRGLVMYRWPKDDKKPGSVPNWTCNIELLRLTREEIDTRAVAEVAFEIALSALYKHMSATPKGNDALETVAIQTARGNIVEVPALAFELAPYMVDRISNVLNDGGGGVPLGFIVSSQKAHARATTGSARNASLKAMPALPPRADRVKGRLAFDARTLKDKEKATLFRRKALAKFWFRNNEGFHRRGLVFRVDANLFWQFNVASENLDPVPCDATDEAVLHQLAMAVSRTTIDKFASSFNEETSGERLLRINNQNAFIDDVLTQDIRDVASERLAVRLMRDMKKHRHGIVGLGVIERCLTVAWDPEDNKPLDDYPFPQAPSANPQDLDIQAWAILKDIEKRRRQQAEERVPRQPENWAGSEAPDKPESFRDEIETEGWVPFDEAYEDDDIIDQRAMQLADHDQSAALRRIRDDASGYKKKAAPAAGIKHNIDYAGLPKDED